MCVKDRRQKYLRAPLSLSDQQPELSVRLIQRLNHAVNPAVVIAGAVFSSWQSTGFAVPYLLPLLFLQAIEPLLKLTLTR